MPADASTATGATGRHYEERVVPFRTEDGLDLHLVNVRGQERPTRGPVVLVHGAGVGGSVFRAPVRDTIVDALLDEGYDVWLENWRASIEVEPNDWNLDRAARYDHPAAVRTVADDTGSDRVKAVIHCQGSTSFTMSACAGLVPQVDTIVSNAVSLHPVVPAWSRAKLRLALPLVSRFLDHLDPGWGENPPPEAAAKAIMLLVKATHHECDNTACRLVSFTYGSGFPALWEHENLNPETHGRWLAESFGFVPMSFFRHMAKCVDRGHLVADQPVEGLLDDYAAEEPRTDARFAFVAGDENRCFLPESQVRSYEHFSRYRPGHHSLHVLPRYSHLDVFMGASAAREVFPLLLEELRGPAPA